MSPYNITVFNLYRVRWLITMAIAGPLLIMTPIALLTDGFGATVIPLLIFTVFCLWFYYGVCCVDTQWRNEQEGMSISVPKPNKFFDFDEIFIRWDDITGYEISDRTLVFPGFSYWRLEVYTYSGNDFIIDTDYSSDFFEFLEDFKSYAAEKSAYLKAVSSGPSKF